MALKYVTGGTHGEVSAEPARIFSMLPKTGINGIGFVDFAYDGVGYGTHSELGMHIGVGEARPGTKILFTDAVTARSVAQDVFVLRGPGDVGRVSWEGGYRARFLTLTPQAVERVTQTPLSRAVGSPVVCDLTERMRVYHLLAAMSYDQPIGDPVDPLFVESLALAVIRAAGVFPCDDCRKGSSLSDAQATHLCDLIAAKLTEPLSLRDMADAVSLSESYFVRAFKGTFGVTPYQYVLRERVALAQSLIRTGELTLAEVALRSGFPDARRMGRTFKQVTGRSPTGATKTRRGAARSPYASSQETDRSGARRT